MLRTFLGDNNSRLCCTLLVVVSGTNKTHLWWQRRCFDVLICSILSIDEALFKLVLLHLSYTQQRAGSVDLAGVLEQVLCPRVKQRGCRDFASRCSWGLVAHTSTSQSHTRAVPAPKELASAQGMPVTCCYMTPEQVSYAAHVALLKGG